MKRETINTETGEVTAPPVHIEPLDRLRLPFPAHHISKLPKPTKAQTEEVRQNFKAGIRCKECGAWHHPQVVHLDYVGHAALTDRLLDTDIAWSWEPMALDAGLPAFDQSGGLWIKLTVAGVTRLGYGNAPIKPNQDPGNREKEVIGDALRNAAMRFGAALDLWHNGDLHGDAASADVEETKDRRVVNPATGKLINPMSPNQARKDGRGERAAALAHEIDDLQGVAEAMAWKRDHDEEVATWPASWQLKLSEQFEQHLGDLRALVEQEDETFPGDLAR